MRLHAISRYFSHRQGDVVSLQCKNGTALHPQQTPPQPSPLWEGVVSTAICENPVASVLSVFNSPLTLRTETILPPPLRSSHLSQGDSLLQPTSDHTSNS